MSTLQNTDFGDDQVLFMPGEDGEPPAGEKMPVEPWVLLVVDDDLDVQSITRLVMGDFTFRDRPVELLCASSAREGREVLRSRPDIAVVLLDVVMESEHAGLELARWIREELGNRIIRIILRTGQPGQAPERDVIIRYDINDYKEKAELTADHLFSAIISSLRAHEDLTTIEEQRRTLEIRVAERTRELRLVLQSLGEGIVGCDAGGRVTFVNPLLTSMVSRPADELLGQPVEEVLPLAGDGDLHPMRRSMQDGQGRHTSDVLLALSGGVSLPVDYLTTPVIDEGVISGAVCAVRDITDRREAFVALGQQFSLLRAVSQSLSVGVLWTDRAGRVLDCNPRGLELLGCSLEELCGGDSFCDPAELLPEGLAEVLQEAPAAGQPPQALVARINGQELALRVSSYAGASGEAAGCVVELTGKQVREAAE